MSDEYGEEIKNLYRKKGLTPPKGKGIHTKAFHSCVVGYLSKNKSMAYSEAAKRCMGALGAKRAVNPSHRSKAMEEFLSGYKVTSHEDGRKTIHNVPIFKTSKKFKSASGKAYDDKWATGAIATYESMKKESNYLPTTFLGHTSEDISEDKPAVGLLDNYVLKGGIIYADLSKTNAEIYGQLKDGKWPYRSIEASTSDSDGHPRIYGLALLGAKPPRCKFPPMGFSDDPNSDVFAFSGDTADKFQETFDQIMPMGRFVEAVATGLTYNQLQRKIQEEVENELEAVSNATASTGVHEKAYVGVRAIFVNRPIAILDYDGDVWSCTYVVGDDNSVGITNLIEVEEQYMPIIQRQLDVAEEIKTNEDEEESMTDEEKKEADLKAAEETKRLEAEEAEKLKAAEKVKADKEAADKLKEELDKNEKNQMSETIVALKAEVASLSERADKAAEDKDVAEIDSWIKGANLKGNLPKAAIEFKGAENGMALRDTLIAATPEVRADIQAFVDNLKSVVKFTETAVVGDEENKEGDSPEAMEQKLSDLTDTYIEEHEGVTASQAMDAVIKANPDIEKYIEKSLPHFKSKLTEQEQV